MPQHLYRVRLVIHHPLALMDDIWPDRTNFLNLGWLTEHADLRHQARRAKLRGLLRDNSTPIAEAGDVIEELRVIHGPKYLFMNRRYNLACGGRPVLFRQNKCGCRL